MPQREDIEDLHAELKILTLGDRERFCQCDIAAHVIRLSHTVTARIAIYISGRNSIGGGIDPVENVALEISLRVLSGIQNAKHWSIGIANLIGTPQIRPYTVLAIATKARGQRLRQTGSNGVDSTEIPSA